MQKPFFSIIIPALNEEKYLPHLLDDLTKQTFRDFEVIVVDGQSDDRTVEKAKRYKAKLTSLKIMTSKKRHVCTQRNLGASVATADTFIFIDADTRIDSNFMLGMRYRVETSNADILSCWFKPDVSNTTNNTISLALNYFIEIQSTVRPRYLIEGLFVIKKQCFVAAGGFNETINYTEGKSLLQTAMSHGCKYAVVRDPVWTYSFRRIRKYGALHVAGNMAKLELSSFLGPEFQSIQAKKLYPMAGGILFTKNKRANNKFLKNLTNLVKKFS